MTMRAEFPTESQPIVERSQRATEQARAANEDLPLAFFRFPWRIVEGDVVNAEGSTVVDVFGTCVSIDPADSHTYMRRIVAAVNVSRTLSLSQLESVAAGKSTAIIAVGGTLGSIIEALKAGGAL